MVDIFSSTKRSSIMSHIQGKNTIPEILVRKLIFSMGYRYRLHRKDLPGCPDIVFPSRKKVIFIHGCFWHRHNCKKGSLPDANKSFWQSKLEQNKIRDAENLAKLEKNGWKVLVIWQCQIKYTKALETAIKTFLDPLIQRSP